MKQAFLILNLILLPLVTNVQAKDYPSPDGKFTVQIQYGDQGASYKITNNQSGQADDSIQLITKLMWLKWADDSKAFVAVEHLAGGSLARLIRFDNNQWTCEDIHPPVEGSKHYSVVKISVEPKVIHVVYKYEGQNDDGDLVFGLSSFDVSIASGSINGSKKEVLNENNYESTAELGD